MQLSTGWTDADRTVATSSTDSTLHHSSTTARISYRIVSCRRAAVSSQQSPPEIQAPLSRSRFLQPELFRASLYNGRPALTDLQFRQSQTRRLDTWQSQNAVSCHSLARSLASWSHRIDELTRRLRITVLRPAAPSRAVAAVLRGGWLRRQGEVGGKAPASASDRPTARAATAAQAPAGYARPPC